MEKINVYICVNDYKISTAGELCDGIVTCSDGLSKISYDINKKMLIKEDSEIKIVLDFDKCEVRICLAKNDSLFINKMMLKSYCFLENQIRIVYLLDEKIYNLLIMYENEEKVLEK